MLDAMLLGALALDLRPLIKVIVAKRNDDSIATCQSLFAKSSVLLPAGFRIPVVRSGGRALARITLTEYAVRVIL